jgi:hypothetical protein
MIFANRLLDLAAGLTRFGILEALTHTAAFGYFTLQ